MSFTGAIGSGFGKVLSALVRWLTLSGIHPNVLTLIGLVVNGVAAWILARGEFLYGGLIILGAAVFDLTDGAVARSANKVTRFGAFLDSVMDRYSDLILLTGLLVHYARIERFSYIVLTAVVMTGTVLVSYSRARAENLIPKCKVGFMERPERIVMAVLSNLTVIHRIVHTWRESRKRAEVEVSDPVAAAETGTSGQAELQEGYRSV